MNRSFIYGIIVASTTWCFSLYLYWLLTKNAPDITSTSIQWYPSQDSQEYVALKHHDLPNSINGISDDDKQRKIQEHKDKIYHRFKVDQKLRKISQRLKDELKPVEESGGTGNRNTVSIFCFKYVSLAFTLINTKKKNVSR